jgi:hypothetical protein
MHRIRLFCGRVPAFAFGVALLVGAVPASAAGKRPPSRKSPHVEISATATVQVAPVRKTHANHREFEELDVQLVTFKKEPGGDGANPYLTIDSLHRIHIVHDLSCGGAWVELNVGDHLELKGEYVHPDGQGDLIHFTHPAGGTCGRAGGHPDGYLRKHANP